MNLLNSVKVIQDLSVNSFSCPRLNNYSGTANTTRDVDITQFGGDVIILLLIRVSDRLVCVSILLAHETNQCMIHRKVSKLLVMHENELIFGSYCNTFNT